jgi:hypothetical protein
MALLTPERNRYFYGKLLDVEQLEKEQRYFNHKRWLLNRLVTGSGVVCGLNITPGENGDLVIQPGVAIDALGREIIVADDWAFDPSQLTDDAGNPSGETLEEGEVEICLAYRESPTDPVPVIVPDCDTADGCAHSTMREEFSVLVRRAGDLPEPQGCGLTAFPLPADGALETLLCQRLRDACPEALEDSDHPCVPLARVTLPVSGVESIAPCAGTPLVYNNRLLYELLLCLADRVTDLARGVILRYVSGDNQIASAGRTLRDPLVVALIDGEGNPEANVRVEFSVLSGGGYLRGAVIREADPTISRGEESRLSVTTNREGQASVSWTLGREHGTQEVIARAVGTALTVTFRAIATETE